MVTDVLGCKTCPILSHRRYLRLIARTEALGFSGYKNLHRDHHRLDLRALESMLGGELILSSQNHYRRGGWVESLYRHLGKNCLIRLQKNSGLVGLSLGSWF